jgi:cytochrome c-type biogenesis protein
VDLLRDWYLLLSRLSAAATVPVSELSARLDMPVASAFLFGLIGAVAPCQLTTNASAMAYVGRQGTRGAALREAVAFLAGKMLVYTLLGGLALLLGAQLRSAAVPLAIWTRKALGPVLILLGLGLLGVLRLRGGFGTRFAQRLRALQPRSGTAGALAMGATFAVAFCPTLFWLFFGLTLPLAVSAPAGLVFPALFAAGTSVPVLASAALLALGAPADGRRALGRAGRLLARLSGVAFVLLGLHDTLIYWAL